MEVGSGETAVYLPCGYVNSHTWARIHTDGTRLLGRTDPEGFQGGGDAKLDHGSKFGTFARSKELQDAPLTFVESRSGRSEVRSLSSFPGYSDFGYAILPRGVRVHRTASCNFRRTSREIHGQPGHAPQERRPENNLQLKRDKQHIGNMAASVSLRATRHTIMTRGKIIDAI
jgi:hypothetical protein